MNSCLWLSRRILHLCHTLICALPVFSFFSLFFFEFCATMSPSRRIPFRYCVAYNRLFGVRIAQTQIFHKCIIHTNSYSIFHNRPLNIWWPTARKKLCKYTSFPFVWLRIWRFCAHKKKIHIDSMHGLCEGKLWHTHLIYTVPTWLRCAQWPYRFVQKLNSVHNYLTNFSVVVIFSLAICWNIKIFGKLENEWPRIHFHLFCTLCGVM